MGAKAEAETGVKEGGNIVIVEAWPNSNLHFKFNYDQSPHIVLIFMLIDPQTRLGTGSTMLHHLQLMELHSSFQQRLAGYWNDCTASINYFLFLRE